MWRSWLRLWRHHMTAPLFVVTPFFQSLFLFPSNFHLPPILHPSEHLHKKEIQSFALSCSQRRVLSRVATFCELRFCVVALDTGSLTCSCIEDTGAS